MKLPTLHIPFFAAFFCKHREEIFRREVNEKTGEVEHFLECLSCLHRYDIPTVFTRPSGVFLRIEDMIDRANEYNRLRAVAQEYCDEMGIQIEV